ncbi:MAG: hypothetical protein ACE5Q6_17440 [Dehalococcoidia bacterium]
MTGSEIWKLTSKAFYRAILLGILGAIITGFIVAYANVGATDLGGGDEDIDLSVNTFVGDIEVTVENSEVAIVTANAAAAGTTPTGVEANVATFPLVNNVLNAGNYSYTFNMRETADGDWLAGESFRIRVYGYDSSGPVTSLLATLYSKQDTDNAAAAVEGVKVTVDLGMSSAIYDKFDIIVDRQ